VDTARVRLRRLDEDLIAALLDEAVEEAEPGEVMPPVPGPPGWTADRKAAFLAFHHEWAATPTTYAILLDDRVVGAARLRPGPTGEFETGLWLGRAHRGLGVGRVVAELLVALARADGAGRLTATTTEANTAARRLLAAVGADTTRARAPHPNGDTLEATLDVTPPQAPEH